MQVFLDLEQTIIESWEKPRILQDGRAHALINSLKSDNTVFHIFSFAIWNEEDQEKFESEMKPFIEAHFGIKIKTWMNVDQMRIICQNHLRIIMDQGDFFGFMKKEMAFPIICNHLFKGEKCFLLDDVVRDSVLIDNETKNIINMINIMR